MKICDEHLYQLEKGMISTETLAQRVQLYRDGGRCFCCNTTDHHKCCQPQQQQQQQCARGRESWSAQLPQQHAKELCGAQLQDKRPQYMQTQNYDSRYCFSDAYRMLQCAANVNANNSLGYRYYR